MKSEDPSPLLLLHCRVESAAPQPHCLLIHTESHCADVVLLSLWSSQYNVTQRVTTSLSSIFTSVQSEWSNSEIVTKLESTPQWSSPVNPVLPQPVSPTHNPSNLHLHLPPSTSVCTCIFSIVKVGMKKAKQNVFKMETKGKQLTNVQDWFSEWTFYSISKCHEGLSIKVPLNLHHQRLKKRCLV